METEAGDINVNNEDFSLMTEEEICDTVDGNIAIEGLGSNAEAEIERSDIVDMENENEKMDVEVEAGTDKVKEGDLSKDVPDTCEVEDSDIVETENDGLSLQEDIGSIRDNPSVFQASAMSSADDIADADDIAEASDSDIQEIDIADIVEMGVVVKQSESNTDIKPSDTDKSAEGASDIVGISAEKIEIDIKSKVDGKDDERDTDGAEVSDSDIRDIVMTDIVEVSEAERQSEFIHATDPEVKGNGTNETSDSIMKICSGDKPLGTSQEVVKRQTDKSEGDADECNVTLKCKGSISQESVSEVEKLEKVSDIMDKKQNEDCVVEEADIQIHDAEGNDTVDVDVYVQSKDNPDQASGPRSPKPVIGKVEVIEISDGDKSNREDDESDSESERETSCREDSEMDTDDEIDDIVDLEGDDRQIAENAVQELKKVVKETLHAKQEVDKNLKEKYELNSGMQLRTLRVRLDRVKVSDSLMKDAHSGEEESCSSDEDSSEPGDGKSNKARRSTRRKRGLTKSKKQGQTKPSASKKRFQSLINRPVMPSELSNLYERNKEQQVYDEILPVTNVGEGSNKFLVHFGTRVRERLEKSRQRRLRFAERKMLKSVLVEFSGGMYDNRPFSERFGNGDKEDSLDDDSNKWPDVADQLSDDSADLDVSEFVDPVTGEYNHAQDEDDNGQAVDDFIIIDIDAQADKVGENKANQSSHGKQTTVTDGRSPDTDKPIGKETLTANRTQTDVEPTPGTSKMESCPPDSKLNNDANVKDAHLHSKENVHVKSKHEVYANLKKEVVKSLCLAIRLKQCEMSDTGIFVHENGLMEHLSEKCIAMMKSMIMYDMERNILAALEELPVGRSDAEDTEHTLLTITDQVLFRLCEILYIYKKLPLRWNSDGERVDHLDMVHKDVEDIYVVDRTTFAEWRKKQQELADMCNKEAKWLTEVNKREQTISMQRKSEPKESDKEPSPPLLEKSGCPAREIHDIKSYGERPRQRVSKKDRRGAKSWKRFMHQQTQELEKEEAQKGKEKTIGSDRSTQKFHTLTNTKGVVDFEMLCQREELRLQQLNLKEKAISLRKRLVEEMDKAERGTEHTPFNDDPNLTVGQEVPNEEMLIGVKEEPVDIPDDDDNDDDDRIEESNKVVREQEEVCDLSETTTGSVKLLQEPLSHYPVETDQGPVPQFLYKVINDAEPTVPFPVGMPYTEAEMRQMSANVGTNQGADGNGLQGVPEGAKKMRFSESENITNVIGLEEGAVSAPSSGPVTFVNATAEPMVLVPISYMKEQTEKKEEQIQGKAKPARKRTKASVLRKNKEKTPVVDPTLPTLVGPFTAEELKRFQTQLGGDLMNAPNLLNNPAVSSQPVLKTGGSGVSAVPTEGTAMMAGEGKSTEGLPQQLTSLQQLLQTPVSTQPQLTTTSVLSSTSPVDNTFPFMSPPGAPPGKPVLVNRVDMAGTCVKQYVIVPHNLCLEGTEMRQRQEAMKANTGLLYTTVNGKLFQIQTASGELLPLPAQSEPQSGQTVPHSSVTMLHSSVTMSHSSVTMPHSGQSLPQAEQVFPQSEQTMPQCGLSGNNLPHLEQIVPHTGQTVPHSGQTQQQSPQNTPSITKAPLYKIVNCQLVQCLPQDLASESLEGPIYRVVNGQVKEVQPDEVKRVIALEISSQVSTQVGVNQSISGHVSSRVSTQGGLTQFGPGQITTQAGQMLSYLARFSSQAAQTRSYPETIPAQVFQTQAYSGSISSQVLQTQAYPGAIPSQVLQTQSYHGAIPSHVLQTQSYQGPMLSQALQTQSYPGPIPSQVLQTQSYPGPIPSQVLQTQQDTVQSSPNKNLYQQFNLTSDGSLHRLNDQPVSCPAGQLVSSPAASRTSIESSTSQPDYTQELHPKILNVFSLSDKEPADNTTHPATTADETPVPARPGTAAKRPELDLYGRIDHTDACQNEKWCVLTWRDINNGLAAYHRDTQKSCKPTELVEFTYLLKQALRREEAVPKSMVSSSAAGSVEEPAAEDDSLPGELKPGKNYDHAFLDRIMVATVVDTLRILQIGITVEAVRLLSHVLRQISKVKPWAVSIDNLIPVLSFIQKEAEKSSCPSYWTEADSPAGKSIWICRVCGKKYRSSETFKKHANVHAKYYALRGQELESEHIYNHCNPSFCIFCKKVFRSAADFYGHYRWPCSADDGFTLPLFKSTDLMWKRDAREYLKHHREIPDDQPKLSLDVILFKMSITALKSKPCCTVCGKTSDSIHDLKKHLSWHAIMEEIQLFCSKCNINFESNDVEFFDHVELHDAGDFGRFCACEQCNIGFLFNHSIRIHYMKSHLGFNLPASCKNYNPYRPDERVKGHVMTINDNGDTSRFKETISEQVVESSMLPGNLSSSNCVVSSRIPEHEEGILSGRARARIGGPKIGPAKPAGSAAIEQDLEKAKASSIAKRKADLERKKQALMEELKQRKERLNTTAASSCARQYVTCPGETISIKMNISDGQGKGVGSSTSVRRSEEIQEVVEPVVRRTRSSNQTAASVIEIDSSSSDSEADDAEEAEREMDGSLYKVIPDSTDLSQIGSFDEVMVGIVNTEGTEMSAESTCSDRSSRESSTANVDPDRRRNLQAEAEASCMATDNLEMRLKSLGVEMVSCDSRSTPRKAGFKLKTNIKGHGASASSSKSRSPPYRHWQIYSAKEVLKKPDSFKDLTQVTVELKRLSRHIPYFT